MYRALQLAYLMLPVYVANMAAPFARHWHGWNRPISDAALGAHKTIVGFAFGVIAAIAASFLQWRIAWPGALVPADEWWAIGIACGMGALGGDAIKSLIKRAVGIPPGERWIPVDQLDFVIGGLIALSPWIVLGYGDLLIVLVLSFFGDIVVNHAAFRLRIRDTAW